MKPRQLTAKILTGFLKFKAKRPTPLFASYNVTGRCNMRCVFCEWWKTDTPELPTKKAMAAIDAVCNLSVPFFDLSGGEPLLRRDLTTLAKRAASHGCLVSMNTNGALLNESRVSEVADVFDLVVVSLDGPKRVHDKIRGVEGTYDKAVEAIKLLKSRRVRVGVNSVVTPWNITILPQFIEELRSQVDFVQVQPIHPYPPPAENTPSEKAVSQLLDYLLRLKRSNPGFLAVPTDFIKGFEAFFRGEAPKICHAGELYVAIDPSGKLLACPARSDIVLADAVSGSVGDVLKEKRDSEGWRKVSSCRGCWLECTVGVSMVLENPLKEASQLISLWTSRKD
ncbi:MAG: radical SAM protein [Candidatus Bathyarchaeum sp.]|nr:MAG: radical SAM protein [Candidatus Bathyarchaeum sp.]